MKVSETDYMQVSESEERTVGQCVRGITVMRADLGAEEGGEDGHYRVTGLRSVRSSNLESENSFMVTDVKVT